LWGRESGQVPVAAVRRRCSFPKCRGAEARRHEQEVRSPSARPPRELKMPVLPKRAKPKAEMK